MSRLYCVDNFCQIYFSLYFFLLSFSKIASARLSYIGMLPKEYEKKYETIDVIESAKRVLIFPFNSKISKTANIGVLTTEDKIAHIPIIIKLGKNTSLIKPNLFKIVKYKTPQIPPIDNIGKNIPPCAPVEYEKQVNKIFAIIISKSI